MMELKAALCQNLNLPNLRCELAIVLLIYCFIFLYIHRIVSYLYFNLTHINRLRAAINRSYSCAKKKKLQCLPYYSDIMKVFLLLLKTAFAWDCPLKSIAPNLFHHVDSRTKRALEFSARFCYSIHKRVRDTVKEIL